MSHYERRLSSDLDDIRARVADLGARVSAAARASVSALLQGDLDASGAVVLGDLAINRDSRALDAICHAFVAIHLPSAGPLRFISSVLRLNIGLERIGDHAVTIAREALQLGGPPRVLAQELREMSTQVDTMLQSALRSWEAGDAALAREIKGGAGAVGRALAGILRSVLAEDAQVSAPLAELYALLVVFSSLDRISDQAKNICEETVFTVTGETKAPKVYRVLFIDRDGAGLSQVAQAIARKTFPESGDYHSAGWDPAEAVDPALLAQLDARGLTPAEDGPSPVGDSDWLADFHVVIGLAPGLRGQLGRLPFHTVLLEWPPPDPSDFDALYRELSSQIRELMEALRGRGAR